MFRGELDWIVMKCLEKDRNRRYATANGLAADIERYLNDEPVQACPPSAWYRLRKLVRRNRVPLAAAMAVLLLMLVSIITLVISNIFIRQEQTRTNVERLRAEEAERLAVARADEIDEGLKSLKAANELVDTGRFYIGERRWDTASDAFTMAIKLRSEHAPAWEARGDLYASLGLWDLAARDLAQAAEAQEPVTSNRWLVLALTRAYFGNHAGYRAACTRMRDLLQGTSVPHFAMDVVRANGFLPHSPADTHHLVSVAKAIVATNPRVGWFVHVLGAAHYRAAEYEEAIERLGESLTIDPLWNASAINYPFLAMAYHRLGRYEEARQALTKADKAIDEWTSARYEAGRQSYWVVSQGSTDFWPVFWWDWMACQLTCGEARRLMGLLPPPDDVRLRVQRARTFAGLRWPEKAVEEYAQALQASPDDRQILLESHRTRGFWHASRRQWKEAAAEYARASELQPDEPYFWWYQAILHLALSDKESYRRVCAGMLDRFRSTDDPRTAHSVVAACILSPNALQEMRELIPVGHVAARWYAGSSRMLAAAQCRAGDCEQAVRNFQEAAIHYRLRADDWLLLAIAHHGLGDVQEARRCLGKAVQWIDQAHGQKLNDPAGTQPGWGDWHERIWVPILRQEVEGLLEK
jgi:tetratricopeptide (TPR) repeat protein